MSTKTAQQFEVGDLVEFDDDMRSKVVETFEDGGAFIEDVDTGDKWCVWLDDLTLIVCEYCGTRKGCECQENIDAREAEAARAEYERGRDEYHAQIAREARR